VTREAIGGGSAALNCKFKSDAGIFDFHMEQTHSGEPMMTYQEFFRERQEARYGGKVGRCC
jgi:uncharacterized short protein YbdD (DUF466 family)